MSFSPNTHALAADRAITALANLVASTRDPVYGSRGGDYEEAVSCLALARHYRGQRHYALAARTAERGRGRVRMAAA